VSDMAMSPDTGRILRLRRDILHVGKGAGIPHPRAVHHPHDLVILDIKLCQNYTLTQQPPSRCHTSSDVRRVRYGFRHGPLSQSVTDANEFSKCIQCSPHPLCMCSATCHDATACKCSICHSHCMCLNPPISQERALSPRGAWHAISTSPLGSSLPGVACWELWQSLKVWVSTTPVVIY